MGVSTGRLPGHMHTKSRHACTHIHAHTHTLHAYMHTMATMLLPQSGGCNGKLMVFHCGLPSASGPGQLKDRLDQKLIGTDKEKVQS